MPSLATISLPKWLAGPLLAAISRLEFSFDPRISIKRLQHHQFTWRGDAQYLVLLTVAACNMYVMPGWEGPAIVIVGYSTLVLVPFTGQFVLPATPIFSWLLHYFSSKYTILFLRPHIWVSVLPTLESVLYGANISDILTRYTSSVLDILAWLPYGVMHFSFPFVAAALIWIFGPPGAVKFFAKVFGWMNFVGVTIQCLFPCAPPWYELLYGMAPADFTMKGSPGGLARIDALFGGNGYTNTFTNSPMPFGAFPSLHAGCSTTDALLLNHFFPRYRVIYVVYVLWLYWSTMYLTHHYLIDLVAGASLAVGSFYFFLNADPWMRDWGLSRQPGMQNATSATNAGARIGTSFAFPGAGVNGMNGITDDGESGYKHLNQTNGGPEDYEMPPISQRSRNASVDDTISSAEAASSSRAISPTPTPGQSAYVTPMGSAYNSPAPSRRLPSSAAGSVQGSSLPDQLHSPRSAPPSFPTLSGASTPSRAGAASPSRSVSSTLAVFSSQNPPHLGRSSISGLRSDAQEQASSSATSSPLPRQNPFLSTTAESNEGMPRPRTPRPSTGSGSDSR